jgi:hypothetical protein
VRVPAQRAARRTKRRSCPPTPVRAPLALAPRLLAPRIRSPKVVGPTGNAPVSAAYQAAALLLSYGPMKEWRTERGSAEMAQPRPKGGMSRAGARVAGGAANNGGELAPQPAGPVRSLSRRRPSCPKFTLQKLAERGGHAPQPAVCRPNVFPTRAEPRSVLSPMAEDGGLDPQRRFGRPSRFKRVPAPCGFAFLEKSPRVDLHHHEAV